MDFTFNQDQLAFRDALQEMLAAEVTAASIRERWATDDGFDAAAWKQFVDMGLTGFFVPENLGGIDLDEVDFVLLAEACGYYAVPEPIVDTTLVSSQLIKSVLDLNTEFESQGKELLQRIAEGSSTVMAGHIINPFKNFAHKADWFLLPHGEEVHLLSKDAVELAPVKSLDPSRRLSKIEWMPQAETKLVEGEQGAKIWRAALNRGALGSAAQLLGLARAMVDMTVDYSNDREQFGKPIGSNQAVKHLMADCAVKIEFAKAVVYRAAYAASVDPNRGNCAVSHAKVAAAEAALLSARNCTQVHGAMGYTWECDLQIWTKRSWALDKLWGDAGFHKNRIHEWLLNPRALLGAEYTFGATSHSFDLSPENQSLHQAGTFATTVTNEVCS